MRYRGASWAATSSSSSWRNSTPDELLAAMQAESVAVKIQGALNQPYLLDQSRHAGEANTRSHHCTSSIGITLFRGQPVAVEELLKRADTAMYQAKAAGRNTMRFFDPQMQAAVSARATLDTDLRTAIKPRASSCCTTSRRSMAAGA
jgi:GGDEF domain-containing protein